MIDYSAWRPTKAKVTTLKLDPENPRIPPTGKLLSQGELLAELIEHDNVYDLAKRITTKGYHVDERLIVVQQDGQTIVLEGNRRLAALKSLLSPDAVPEEHRAKFSTLSNRIPRDLIKVVEVVIAPSREVAWPRIADKHTIKSVERWEPAQKARFYRALCDSGRDREDICREYDLTPSKLEDFLRQETLYQMACSLELPEEVQAVVQNPRAFPLSTLNRFLESTEGRKFLGIEPDDACGFKGSVHIDEFRKAFGRIVHDVANPDTDERVTSRTIHSSEDVKTYIGKQKAYRARKTKKGEFTADDVIGQRKPDRQTKPKTQRKAARRRSSKKLFRSDLKCTIDSPRVNGVFTEIKRLNIAGHENTLGVMMRVLLELSVVAYFKRTGQLATLVERHGQGRKADYLPTLRMYLDELLKDQNLPLERHEKKELNRFFKSTDTWFHLDSLDSMVHNLAGAPSESDLRTIYERLDPLFRILLSAPEPTET